MESGNLKDVMVSRVDYYDGVLDRLAGFVECDGVSVEDVHRRRRDLVSEVACAVGKDLGLVSRGRLGYIGSPYYGKMLDEFGWYLRDVLGCLRLYSGSDSAIVYSSHSK
jgi:hypothetical protein